jgi:hypothetical protein
VKESVKDSLRDLESTAATSKTPSEFFENVQKTEFFENVKRNLVGSILTFTAAEDGVILCWFSTLLQLTLVTDFSILQEG